jgi:hypothetical protein
MWNSLIEQAIDCDRQLKAARTPEEKAAAIGRRKLVRGRMEFNAAMAEYERTHPVGPIRESFNVVP